MPMFLSFFIIYLNCSLCKATDNTTNEIDLKQKVGGQILTGYNTHTVDTGTISNIWLDVPLLNSSL